MQLQSIGRVVQHGGCPRPSHALPDQFNLVAESVEITRVVQAGNSEDAAGTFQFGC